MSYPQVADLSSAQNGFDPAAYAASERQAVIIKSTESTGYHFAVGDIWEIGARNHELVVGRYHWAGSSLSGVIHDPSVEGDFFLLHNGDHTPGRFAAVDFENPLHGAPLYGLSPLVAAQWSGAFLDHIAGKGGWPGMGYSFSGADVMQQLKAPYLRWLAAYPGPVPPCALHQFSSSAPVPGVGRCDDSYCFVDLRSFAGTSGPPVPPPVPQEELMPTVRIPEPNASSPVTVDGKRYEKGAVATVPGTKGLVSVTADGFPAGAPLVRVAIGSGRADGVWKHKHPDAGIHENVGVANWPANWGYDHTTPFGVGFDEEAAVVNYGPGDVTLSAVPTN